MAERRMLVPAGYSKLLSDLKQRIPGRPTPRLISDQPRTGGSLLANRA